MATAPYYTIGYHRVSDDSVTCTARYWNGYAVTRDVTEMAESEDIDQVWIRTWNQATCTAIDYVKGARG